MGTPNLTQAITFPPCGFDWADGVTVFEGVGKVGTATPAEALIQIPGPIYFEEDPNSPEIERAEQATFRHVFECSYDTAAALTPILGRGTVLKDTLGNYYYLLSSRIRRVKGGRAQIEIVSESISLDVPPDEFECTEVEFNTAIEKHPKYVSVWTYNLTPDGTAKIDDKQLSGYQIIQEIHNTAELPQIVAREASTEKLNQDSIKDPAVLELALEIMRKIRRSETEFYLPGLKVQWSWFSFLSPYEHPGGIIEDPARQGHLPAYFWSSTGLPGGNNVFDYLAYRVSPKLYRNGISWLRLRDNVTYQRTFFRLTQSWIGGPWGQWDKDIYSYDPHFIPPSFGGSP